MARRRKKWNLCECGKRQYPNPEAAEKVVYMMWTSGNIGSIDEVHIYQCDQGKRLYHIGHWPGGKRQ